MVDNDGSETYPASKLPNIRGNCYTVAETWNSSGSADGAFQKHGGYRGANTPGYKNDHSDSGAFSFDASRSSSIYTNSFNAVQPSSTNIYRYIKLT